MEITATPPQGEICDGTGSQFSCFGVIYLCTKDHAFTTKCTINAAIRWTKMPGACSNTDNAHAWYPNIVFNLITITS